MTTNPLLLLLLVGGGGGGRRGPPRRSPGRARSGSTSVSACSSSCSGCSSGCCSAAATDAGTCCSTCPRSRCPAGSPASRCSARSPASRCSPACTTGCGWPTIVICVGAANALANPKRLLRSVPPALYEIGTALVVAVTVLPQFADSVRRVRAAQALRARESGRVGAAAPAARPGARGRPRAVAGARRRHGRPRLRPRPATSAAARRRATGDADARRAGRHLRRRLRRARPHRARAGWRCRCWPSGALAALAGLLSAGRRVRAHPLPPRPLALARARGRGRGPRGRAAAAVGRASPAGDRVPRAHRRAHRQRGRRCSASWPRWPAALCAPPPVPPAPVTLPDRARRRAAEVAAMIELRGIRFAYDRRRPAGPATGSTSTIEEGELVLVSGPHRRRQVDAARRRHRAGAALQRRPPRRRRAARRRAASSAARRASAPHVVGYVGQDPVAGFVTDTVEEELAYGMEQLGLPAETMRRRVEETLDLLGIADLRGARPAHAVAAASSSGSRSARC